MATLLLRGKLCLYLLLSSKMLSPRVLFSLLLCLPLLQGTAPFSFLFLLLPLGQFLLELDFVLPFRFLLMLHANVFQGFEPGETRLERCTAACIIDGRFRASCAPRGSWLEPFIHDKHESLLLSGQCFISSKFRHCPLPSFRRWWRIIMERALHEFQ